jgi:thiamine-phosphate pyrophosphorylase
LCLVTDRARLGGRAAKADALAALVAQVGAAARGGVDLVQIRERDLPARDLLDLVGRCLDAAQGTGARVVVNDRLDVALASGAHGVHLRGDSLEARRVRAIAPPGFLVGRSVHEEAEAVAAASGGHVDYLILGTFHESASKPPGHPRLGLEDCGRIARAVNVPVLAIGGLTLDRLPAVLRAGAAGVAAIGLFAGEGDDPGSAARRARAAADAVVGGGRSGKLTSDFG